MTGVAIDHLSHKYI